MNIDSQPIYADYSAAPDAETGLARFMRAWRRIGGGSLAASVLVHIALIIIAGIVVITAHRDDKPFDFVPLGRSNGVEKLHGPATDAKRAARRSALVGQRVAAGRIRVDKPSEFSLPNAPMETIDIGGSSGLHAGMSVCSGGGANPGIEQGSLMAPRTRMALPPTMSGRCSPIERLRRIRESGGTAECESGVSRSLAWLKGKQNADGSWGRANRGAMTGLALLCYLGRCETPDSPFYGDNVMRGILYLIELGRQNPHGILSEDWEGAHSGAGVYEHGIGTYALGEMYTLARLGDRSLPGLRDTFERGVRVIIDNQQSNGSWSYGGRDIVYHRDSAGDDLSVTGWQYQALKAAKNSGLKIAGLQASIDKAIGYLSSKQTRDGGFGRVNRDEHYNQWSLSGCGILGLQTLGSGKKMAAQAARGVKFLRQFLSAEPLDWNRNCNLYCWYYYTQAFFQQGGDDWRFYNAQFLPAVLGAQQPDGSFKRGRANWPAGDAADEIYRQTLCTLQLEVYYRYLKVADRQKD